LNLFYSDPSYLLYDKSLFKKVRFKNKRIYWNDQFDFNLDQILERGHIVKVDEKAQIA
jgi:hypothetical protein